MAVSFYSFPPPGRAGLTGKKVSKSLGKHFEVFGKTFRSLLKNISKFSGKHLEVFPIPSRRVLPRVWVRSPAPGFWALPQAFDEFTGAVGKITGMLRHLANGLDHFAKGCRFQEILPDCGFLEYA